MTTDECVAELVNRLVLGQPLLPLPEASQDLALLAFVIERQQAAIRGAADLGTRAALDALDDGAP